LAALDTVILAVSFRPAEFNRDLWDREGLAFRVLSDSDGAVIKRYNVWNHAEDAARRVTFWIGRDGMIRRVWDRVNPTTMGAELIEFARAWKKGQAIYQGQCARCHGDDGNDTSYAQIRTLGGIGNRLAEEELLKATEATGIVDLSRFTQEELRALMTYVAAL
jgi:alkyl hydroperoxide reductase subunit AhpC